MLRRLKTPSDQQEEQVQQQRPDPEQLPINSSSAYSMNRDDDGKDKVVVIGSGNWGTVTAKIIASNTVKLARFHGTLAISSVLGVGICLLSYGTGSLMGSNIVEAANTII